MSKPSRRQYTIRNVPDHLDRVLRRRARESGKSFNQIALQALAQGAGEPAATYDDLDFMIGSMNQKEGERMDKEIALQRLVDPELWR